MSDELYYRDVILSGTSESQYPDVALHAESLDAAKAAGLSPTAQTLDNKIRFWARSIPAQKLKATVALLGGNGNYVLPIATGTTLGGVMVGDGLAITEDGILSVVAGEGAYLTREQAEALLAGYVRIEDLSGSSDGQIDELFAETEAG